MGPNACGTAAGAGAELGAHDSKLQSGEAAAESGVDCPFTTAHASACAALEDWKAANPWWNTVKNKQLPQEFWNLRRHMRNSKRSLQQHAKQRAKRQATKRQAASQDPEELSPEQVAQHAAAVKAAKQWRLEVQTQQQARMEAALREGLRIVVDCSFIAACSAREMRSLAKQLQQCVAVNKRATRPACLTFAAYTGPLREFCQRMGGERWAANRLQEAVLDRFPASSLVMLSPDAKQPLEALDPGRVYCVGGLVDRSPRKGITMGVGMSFTPVFAEQHSIDVRRLPIEEQQLKTADGAPVRDRNFILNVDSVVAALLAVHGGSSWAAALDAAVPMRKRRAVSAGPGTSGNGDGSATGDADGDDTAHALSSDDDAAGANACAADAGGAVMAGSGSGHGSARQQGDGALADAADGAALPPQSNVQQQ